MKKNVALVHYSYPPVIGGVEFIMEGHARVLAQHGYRVKIIAGAGASNVENIDVHIIENFKPDTPKTKTVQTELDKGLVTGNFEDLKNELKASIKEALKDIQVCFIHNIFTMHFNLALTAALSEVVQEEGKEKFFYAWCHDATFNLPYYSLPSHETYPWNLLGHIQERCQYIAISELRQKELSKLFGVEYSSIKVVPDGIDVKSFLGIKNIIWDIASELGLFDQDLVMFFPSRILRRKNYELAIKITGCIKNNGNRCLLLLTGPPDPHNPDTSKYLKELRSLIKDLEIEEDIIFIYDLKEKYGPDLNIGYVELQNFYSLSDLLLLTSSQEGFGIPLLEAAAKKLPIACPNISPLKEIVKGQALLFEIQDKPEEIARQIIEFLKNQPTYHMFRRLMVNFSWEAIYKNYLKELVEV